MTTTIPFVATILRIPPRWGRKRRSGALRAVGLLVPPKVPQADTRMTADTSASQEDSLAPNDLAVGCQKVLPSAKGEREPSPTNASARAKEELSWTSRWVKISRCFAVAP